MGLHALDVPVIWVEQNPERLGPTVPEIADLLEGMKPIPKLSFSACGEPRVLDTLNAAGRPKVLAQMAGLEFQTPA